MFGTNNYIVAKNKIATIGGLLAIQINTRGKPLYTCFPGVDKNSRLGKLLLLKFDDIIEIKSNNPIQ